MINKKAIIQKNFQKINSKYDFFFENRKFIVLSLISCLVAFEPKKIQNINHKTSIVDNPKSTKTWFLLVNAKLLRKFQKNKKIIQTKKQKKIKLFLKKYFKVFLKTAKNILKKIWI